MSSPHDDMPEWVNVKRDPTTGLKTLVSLFATMEEHLGNQLPPDRPLCLLHLDLDRLSRLNDSLGQTAGDDLLRRLVDCMTQAVESSALEGAGRDNLYRMGGDEFAVLLPNTRMEQAVSVAESIRDLFSQNAEENLTHATVSIGMAAIPDTAHDLGSLVTAADVGVLDSKRDGGNSVHVPVKETPGGHETVVASRIINMLARRMVETGALLEEAQKHAYTDPITGLPNHRALNRFLEREHVRAGRYGHPYSLLLVDGDSLKKFNDTLGREAGNDWIRRLGRQLTRQTRASDLVARWFTGDEFVVVMTEAGLDEALLTAERIREEVELEGRDMSVSATVSIGVAAFPRDADSPKLMLDRADEANTQAKRLGRNRVVAYESISEGGDAAP